MKRLNLIGVIIFAFCMVFSCASPALKAELVLNATSDKHFLSMGDVTITVTTHNKGADYSYFGSTSMIGAIPVLYSIINNNIYELACAPVIEAGNYENIVFKKDDKIIREWHFSNDGRYGAVCPSGVYSLKLTFNEFGYLYPIFLLVSNEGVTFVDEAYDFEYAEDGEDSVIIM